MIIEHFTGIPTIVTDTEGEVKVFNSIDLAEEYAKENIQNPQIIPYEPKYQIMGRKILNLIGWAEC